MNNKFSYLQQYSYNVLMAGYNVFLTGGAGTGKSTTLIEFIKDIQEQGYNVLVCAPTGIAALNINGITAHRAFDMPLGPLTYTNDNYEVDDTIIQSDIIIIDEISMCRIDWFDFIANKILKANNIRKRYGKSTIQFIVSGDFLQLPPVLTEYEKRALDRYYGQDVGAGFAFNSKFWKMFDFKNIILTDVIRQNNIDFIQNINRIRVGEKAAIDYFIDNSNKLTQENGIILCGKVREAQEENDKAMSNLVGVNYEIDAIINGDVQETDTQAEFTLKLKLGCRVMMLVNYNNEYNNGSLGNVIQITNDIITIRLDNGNIIDVKRFTWDVYRYKIENIDDKQKLVKEKVGDITQFPLKLAYAITIHKSQGQTYETVNIKPYCWDCGQLYVALSRVKSIDGLHFMYKPDMKYLVISLNVIKFYNSIVQSANQTLDTTKDLRVRTDNIQKGSDEDTILNLLKNI